MNTSNTNMKYLYISKQQNKYTHLASKISEQRPSHQPVIRLQGSLSVKLNTKHWQVGAPPNLSPPLSEAEH